MHTKERRLHRRITLGNEHVATCVLTGTEGLSLHAEVLDVSLDGVHVVVPTWAVDSWPGLRQRAEVALVLDEVDELSCEIEVVWLGGATWAGERALRAGLRITAFEPDPRARWAAWIDGLGEQ